MSSVNIWQSEWSGISDVVATDKILGYDASASQNKYITVQKLRVGGGDTAFSDATAGAITYTAAQVIGGIIVRDPNGAGRTDVFPTAALLVAGLTSAAVGDVIDCLIINGADASETITLSAGSGGGFDTNQTASSRVIPQNSSKRVRIRLTNVTASSEAYVIYA